jgi:hypothetical protein
MATMPTPDPTGRRPPAQPKMPTHRPAQGQVRKLTLAKRDPRARRSR